MYQSLHFLIVNKCYKIAVAYQYLDYIEFVNIFLLSFMTSLFSNDYLPDRLDITDIDSIAYMEFVETQKRKNDISIIVKIFKFIFRG